MPLLFLKQIEREGGIEEWLDLIASGRRKIFTDSVEDGLFVINDPNEILLFGGVIMLLV